MKSLNACVSLLLISLVSTSAFAQDATEIRKAISQKRASANLNVNFADAKKSIQGKYGAEVAEDMTRIVRTRGGFVAYLRGDVYLCEMSADGSGKDNFYFISMFNECFTLKELGLK